MKISWNLFLHSLFRNVFWKSKWHVSDLNFTWNELSFQVPCKNLAEISKIPLIFNGWFRIVNATIRAIIKVYSGKSRWLYQVFNIFTSANFCKQQKVNCTIHLYAIHLLFSQDRFQRSKSQTLQYAITKLPIN